MNVGSVRCVLSVGVTMSSDPKTHPIAALLSPWGWAQSAKFADAPAAMAYRRCVSDLTVAVEKQRKLLLEEALRSSERALRHQEPPGVAEGLRKAAAMLKVKL